MNMRKLFYLALAAASIGAGGCATAPEVVVVKKRVFYPYPPETPRVEFLGAYQNQHNFPKTAAQIRKEKIFGKDAPLSFGRPVNVASDGKGRVYISDTEKGAVIIYDLVNYTIKKLGKDGVFIKPSGLAVATDGKVYVTDTFKKKVFVFDKDNEPLFSIGENKEFEWPSNIAVHDRLGRLYVTDVKKHSVLAFDKNGEFLFSIGKRGSGEGNFNFPLDVEVAPDGNIVVLDAMNARVQIFEPSGEFIRAFGQRGSSLGSFDRAKGLGIDTEGHIYVSDAGSNNIKIFDMEGRLLMVIGASFDLTREKMGLVPGGFSFPAGVDVDDKNGIFVADQMNRLFQHFQYMDEEYLKKNPLSKRVKDAIEAPGDVEEAPEGVEETIETGETVGP